MLAVWPVCFLFTSNLDELGWDAAVLRWGGLMGVGSVLLYLAAYLPGRRADIAALTTSIAVGLFYCFPWIARALPASLRSSYSEWILLGCLSLLPFAAWRRLSGSESGFSGARRILEVVAFVAIVQALLPIASYWREPDGGAGSGAAVPASVSARGSYAMPDVYYIMLDGYARDDVLAGYFGFDNENFLRQLESRGFFVASDSAANYSQTRLSIPSSLNMSYLADLDPRLATRRRSGKPRRIRRSQLNEWIHEAAVFRQFKSLGYSFHLVTSAFRVTSWSPHADQVHACGGLSQFGVLVVQQSALRILRGRLLRSRQREQLLCQYETLAALARIDGPKFVFSHIVSPHGPWLFAADGGRVELDQDYSHDAESEGEAELYLDQVRFNNGKLLALLDSILAADGLDPIVLLQSDHGSWYSLSAKARRKLLNKVRQSDEAEVREMMMPGTPLSSAIKERMTILNAYRFPGGKAELLYPGVSPVNSFRILFDGYFGTSLGLLEDESYYSLYSQPHRMFEATRIARRLSGRAASRPLSTPSLD